MPYDSLKELPESIRNSLPSHGQEIFMKAFNNAWDQYADPSSRRGNASREEVAMKVAWSAVKQMFEKRGNKWVEKD
jgi:cation transport regulator